MRGYCEPLSEERDILEHRRDKLIELIETHATSAKLAAHLADLLVDIEARLQSCGAVGVRRAA